MTEAVPAQEAPVFEFVGRCPVCETEPVRFVARGEYFRSTLRCQVCQSAPRERALIHVVETHLPEWRKLRIHESSPGVTPASLKLQRECPDYVATQYDPGTRPGETIARMGQRCENLEAQTFPDASFDLVVTQDVFEHVFRPDRAVAEIARTLKPGGLFISTVPMVRGRHPSRRRAELVDGEVRHLVEPPEYHGNPLGGGALVTIDWGWDIAGYFLQHGGLFTTIHDVDRIELGIRASLNHVLVAAKPRGPRQI